MPDAPPDPYRPPSLTAIEKLIGGLAALVAGVLAGAWFLGLVFRVPFFLADTRYQVAPFASLGVLLLLVAGAVLESPRAPKLLVASARALAAAVGAAAFALGARRALGPPVGVDLEAWLPQVQVGARALHVAPTAAFILAAAAFATAALGAGVRRPWREAARLAALGVLVACGIGFASRAAGLSNLLMERPVSPWTGSFLFALGLALLVAHRTGHAGYRLVFASEPGTAVPPEERRARRRVAASLAALALVALGTVVVYLHEQIRLVRERIAADLVSVATVRASQVAEWRTERLADALVLMHAPVPAAADDDGRLATFLRTLRTAYGYHAATLYDERGEPVLADAEHEQAPHASARILLDEARRLGTPVASDLHVAPDGAACLDVALPLLNATAGSRVRGALLQVNPARQLFPLLAAWPTRTATAETFLFRREEESVLYLSPLRFVDGPPLSIRRSLAQPDLIAARVLAGADSPSIDGRSYRGSDATAVARPVPGTTWNVMAQMDLDEVAAPVRGSARLVFLGLAAFAAFGLWSAAALWRQRQAELIESRRQAESARLEAADRLAAVMRHANDGLLLLDEGLRILDANDRAVQLYGYPLEELRGMELARLRAPETLDTLAAQLRQAATAQGAVFETRHVRRDGSAFPVEVSSRLVEVAGRTYRLSLVRDITDRKAQEAELRKVSSAVAQSPVSIVITDLDGRIEFVNPRFCEVSGYTFDELRGRNPRVIKSGLTPRDTFTDLWRTITAGKVWRGEIVNRSKAGHLYVELAVVAPVTDADGRTTHYVGVKEDITARNAMEHALRESEERYRLIADHTKDMIWLADVATGLFTWVSPSFTRVRGFTPEELVGTPVVEMQHPGARRRVGAGLAERIAAFERGDEGARHRTDELEALCRDGSYIWTEVVTTLMADASGKVRTMLGVTRDITARRRAEAELRKLTSAIEQSPVSIVITNLDAEIEYVNPWFTLTTGYAFEDVRGRNPRILQSGETPEDVYVEMWRTLTAGEVWRGELTNRRKNGERYVELAVIAPVLDENGYVTHYAAIKEDITERKRMERALVESEEHYRLLADNSRDMIWLGDLDSGLFTYVSPGSLAVCGRAPDELVGRPMASLAPGDGGGPAVGDLSARAAALAAGDETARYRTDEMGIERPDGSRAWIEVATTLMASRGDRAGQVLGVARDVTARKAAEAALRANEARLQEAQTIAQLGSWELDLRTGRLSRSPEVYRIFERSPDAWGASSEAFFEAVHPDDRARVQAEYFSSFGDEAPREVDHRIRLGGNDVRWVRARWRTEFDGGAPVRVSGTIQDVTERMRSEELRQRRDELRQVEYDVRRAITEAATVEAAAPAVLRALAPRLGFEAGLVALLDGADHDLRTVAAWTDGSDEARAVAEVGRELHLFHGPALDERLAGGRAIWGHEVRERAREIGGPWRAAVEGGGFVTSATLPLASEGRPLGLVTLFSRRRLTADDDVTAVLEGLAAPLGQFVARARAQDELRAERNTLAARVEERTIELRGLNAALARASRMKDEFLASMSHELRTPLNAILGLSEALQENVYGALQPRQREALQTVEESGRHLLELINDILDLSKIEAGKVVLELSDVPLGAACAGALRLVLGAAQAKHVSLESSVVPEDAEASADPRRLKQILVNLLSNAVKFTPEGGRAGVEARLDGEGWVRIVVWDTGIGIAAEDVARLFQPFTQLDSSLSRQHAGTGLGLALVRRLAELHGGAATLESEPGKGTRVTVRLPAAARGHAAVAAPALRPGAVRRVLLVEDEAATAAQIRRYMEETGRAVAVLDRGRPALQAAVEQQPDVVLLDLLLPDVPGWEVLLSLKADERTRHIPVVIVSVVEDRARAFGYGAAESLTKPVTREMLVSAIDRLGAAPAAAPATPAAAARPLVLLAEDNDTNARTFVDFLSARGFEVVLARDGGEAAELAQARRPALVLMDVQMPRVDGIEGMRRIRACPALAGLPIVALTALAMPGDRERCLDAGASAYLAKPVRLKELAETIGELLRAPTPEPPTR